ncbi:MAG: hypothetical protein ACRECA_08950, partial [Pseudolabrys sp.]
PPATDADGRTGSYRSLRNALKAYIVARVNQGNAAQVTFSPLQAKDSSGTSSKAINAVPIWLNDDTSASDALVAQVGAATLQTDVNLKDKIVVFEIEPEVALDMANGFNHVALQTSASNASNVTEAELFILQAAQGASAPTTYA